MHVDYVPKVCLLHLYNSNHLAILTEAGNRETTVSSTSVTIYAGKEGFSNEDIPAVSQSSDVVSTSYERKICEIKVEPYQQGQSNMCFGNFGRISCRRFD
jgi:hypothetical protein